MPSEHANGCWSALDNHTFPTPATLSGTALYSGGVSDGSLSFNGQSVPADKELEDACQECQALCQLIHHIVQHHLQTHYLRWSLLSNSFDISLLHYLPLWILAIQCIIYSEISFYTFAIPDIFGPQWDFWFLLPELAICFYLNTCVNTNHGIHINGKWVIYTNIQAFL